MGYKVALDIPNTEEDDFLLSKLQRYHSSNLKSKSVENKTSKKIKEFTKKFNELFPNEGLLKLRRKTANEPFNANLFFSNDKGWYILPPEKFDECVFFIFDEMGIRNENEQNKILKSFFAPYTIDDSELNQESEQLLAFNDGQYICLKELENKHYGSVSDLWADKGKWLKNHKEMKSKNITLHMHICLPMEFDAEKQRKDFNLFKRTLLNSLGERKDTFDWLMDESARHCCNYGNDQGFVGCVGAGDSGKSSFVNMLQDIFGDYSVVTPFSYILEESAESRKFFYKNRNARFFFVSETGAGEFGLEFLKGLTANTSFSADDKKFRLNTCFIFDSNYIFKTKRADSGIERRYHLVGFGRKGGENISDLLQYYLALSQSFLLELLVRFSNLDLSERVTHPKITAEIKELYKYASEPISFFIQKCYSPAPINSKKTRIDINKLKTIVYQELLPYHKEYCEGQFFYNEYMNEHVYKNFSIADFYHQLMLEHTNFAFTARQPVFYNMALGRPDPFETMREKIKNELCQSGMLISPLEMDTIINAAARKASVDYAEEDVEDLSYMDSDKGIFSFHFFMIKKQDFSEDIWKNKILEWLCIAYSCYNLFHINQFEQWINSIVSKNEQLCKLKSAIDYYIRKNCALLNLCKLDSELARALDILFSEYQKWIRSCNVLNS